MADRRMGLTTGAIGVVSQCDCCDFRKLQCKNEILLFADTAYSVAGSVSFSFRVEWWAWLT